MIQISEKTRQEYLKDTQHKNLYITVDEENGNITGINWYIWHFSRTGAEQSSIFSFFTAWHDEINQQYLRYADYLYLSCRCKFNGNRSDLNGSKVYILINYPTLGGYGVDLDETDHKWAIDALMGDGLRIFCRVDKADIPKFCQSGDPEYGGEYPLGWVLLDNVSNANMTIDDIQLQCEYQNYTFDELYPPSNRTNYKLPYLGYSSFASNNTIQAIVRRPAESIDPIYNSNILKESQSLVESVCSRDTLKIGSSEAATYEITLMNRLEAFSGRNIRPYIATKEFAENASAFEWREINWVTGVTGRYQPDSSNYGLKWTNTNISSRKVFDTNYIGSTNPKYVSDAKYFAVRYKFKISEYVSETSPSYINAGVRIKFKNATYLFGSHFDFADAQSDYLTCEKIFATDSYGGIEGLTGLLFIEEDENQQTYSSGTATITIRVKEIQVVLLDANNTALIPTYDSDDCIEWRGIDADRYIYERQRGIIDHTDEPIEAIPLGKFYIKDAKVASARTYKKNTLLGYDMLYNLSVNASNWYRMYMFALSLDGYMSGGYEYVRQMYSTYWNIMSALMLDSRKSHNEVLIYSENEPHYKNSTRPKPGGGYYGAISKSWEVGEGDPQSWFFEHLWFGEVDITVAEQDDDFLKHPLVFDMWYIYSLNYHYGVLQSYHYVYSSYRNFIDAYGRGIYNRACILIDETLDDNTHNKFCVDNGDYFMLSPNCVSFKLYYPCTQYPHTDNAGEYRFAGGDSSRPGVQLRSVKDLEPDFINASTRLAYYNYDTLEIFDSNNSITARDVVRSLLEINGCFLDADRNGELRYVYFTKEGLYPAEDLYPADDLYPRGTNVFLGRASYSDSDYADYITKEYGRIQIRKMASSDNAVENVVQWEYIGAVEYENTYVMDDNVFYSGTNMVYNKGGMPEVDKMLANMYSKILDLTYTPNVTRGIGLPWIEAGDRVNIMTVNGGFESFIFKRTMSGIQMLKDVTESYGDEVEQSVDSYAINTYTDTPIAPYHT